MSRRQQMERDAMGAKAVLPSIADSPPFRCLRALSMGLTLHHSVT